MNEFFTDLPITGEDGSPDRLNREGFAKRIGQGFLLNPRAPGLVVSIEGAWGSGKTSFINLILKYFNSLAEDEQPVVIHFNPWIFSGSKDIVSAFLRHFAAQLPIASRHIHSESAATLLLQYARLFSQQTDAEENSAQINASCDIVKIRADIAAALALIGKPIIIFIDDIDRILAYDVYNMLRSVKAVADFPRVVFVLALDPAYVELALANCKIEDPRSYLDKIIQVHLNLPLVSSCDIDAIVKEELERLPEVAKKDYFPDSSFRFSEMYQFSIKYLLRSPRDVKRLFNRLYISTLSVNGEVSFCDLFSLEVIALKAPAVYEHIRACPDAYSGIPANTSVRDVDPKMHVRTYEQERSSYIDALPREIRRYTRQLLENLFPLLDPAGAYVDQDYYSGRGFVAAADRLMIALSYGLPSSEVPQTTVKEFLVNSASRNTILENIVKSSKLARFFELLRAAIEEVKVRDHKDFLDLMAELADSVVVSKADKNNHDILSTTLVNQIWWVCEKLLCQLKKPERLAYIKSMLTYPDRLTLATYVLKHCLKQSGFYNAREALDPRHQWCSDEELSTLKGNWLFKVETVFASKFFCSLTGKSEILALMRLLDEDITRELVTEMLADDADLDCIASALSQGGIDSVKGRYAYVTPEILQSIGGADTVRYRVAKRAQSKTPMSEAVRATYKSIMTGKKIYLIDGSEAKSEFHSADVAEGDSSPRKKFG